MITTDKKGIAEFIDILASYGIREVVCSPGSRNAPLIIAIDNHPDLKTIVIHDERSAAFYALGMAQGYKRPIALVCTSGSAMLNYYPAVAEAYYQCVPLIVISADRPKEWIDQGDGQTIVQKGVYQNHIRYQAEISENINKKEDEDEMSRVIEEGLKACDGRWKGPIHFNVPISEPMYGTIERLGDKRKAHNFLVEEDEGGLKGEEIEKIWKESNRILILCGQMDRRFKVLEALSQIAKDSSVVVMVENTSNLVDNGFIHCIDRTLNGIPDEEIVNYRPDLLITIGGAIVSKRIKKFLRDSDILHHWKIGYEFPEMDTYLALSKSIKMDTVRFLQILLNIECLRKSSFGNKWKQVDFLVQERLTPFFKEIEYADLSVFNSVLDYLPENSNLHMGNSSVVRYCQLFDPVKTVTYFSNRGTSGIDGCTSTACGVALASPEKLNILITGDVSFFYDSNALWNNEDLGNLKIILINNDGGGIFNIIDGPRTSDQNKKYFEAKHGFSAEHICRAFNVNYYASTDLVSLEARMKTFFNVNNDKRPSLLEVYTPSELNHNVLKDFFKYAVPR